jgi:hypothetical protein
MRCHIGHEGTGASVSTCQNMLQIHTFRPKLHMQYSSKKKPQPLGLVRKDMYVVMMWPFTGCMHAWWWGMLTPRRAAPPTTPCRNSLRASRLRNFPLPRNRHKIRLAPKYSFMRTHKHQNVFPAPRYRPPEGLRYSLRGEPCRLPFGC